MTSVINQLHFRSNSKTILPFLKSKELEGKAPELFSLNSIVPMPELLLDIALTDEVKRLSLLNIEIPDLTDSVKKIALEELYLNDSKKLSKEAIKVEIEKDRESIDIEGSDRDAKNALLDRATENLNQLGFISWYDWRLSHWGTIDDIISVTTSTFVEDTPFLEFVTSWTPPIAALRTLANTFPSVRFELQYRLQCEEKWAKKELFPLNPFGY